jgi:surface protein
LAYIQDAQEPVGTINITGEFVNDPQIYYTDETGMCVSAQPTIENDNEVYRFINSDSLLGTIEIKYKNFNYSTTLPMIEIGQNGITLEHNGGFHKIYNINEYKNTLLSMFLGGNTSYVPSDEFYIKIHGEVKAFGLQEDKFQYGWRMSNALTYNQQITYFKIKGMSSLTNVESMLEGCTNLTKENLDLSEFDTSNITNMNSMFKDCTSLSELNLSNFNVNSVTSMENMFDGCTSLSAVDFTGWCVANIDSEPSNFAAYSLFTERPNWGQPC